MLRLETILQQVSSYAPDADLGRIKKAWVFASKYHKGQQRKSGEPYFAHPLEVANILAELRMDVDTLIVAILHDTVEDTDATLEDIEQGFGVEVAEMVDGVTKLDKLSFRTAEEAQAENFRKLVLAMAKDIRVVVVKLADRLHNMRTLGAMRPEKRVRIAQETMDLYAPIANRLGIVAIKGALEDLSFRYLHEDVAQELESQIAARAPYFDATIERVQAMILESLEPLGIQAQVSGRVKRQWSIWTKMQEKELCFDEVDDLLAFRIIVDDLSQCYAALGTVHGLWSPVSERFKDYIAQPKTNGYQSLHTTVVGPDGQRVEVQIRTKEMHRFAEFGIAAHWKYKEGRLALKREEIDKFTKIQHLLQWAEDIEDSREFIDVLKVDLYVDQVYVYTPTGELRWFPRGATPLDFAYSIHTDIGEHCVGARVNGRMVKITHPLSSGDRIEILTRPDQHPKKDWLKHAVTSRAKSKIRQYLRREEKAKAGEVGQSLFDQELRKYGSSLKAVLKKDGLKAALDQHSLPNPEALYRHIGFGHVGIPKLLPLYITPEVLDRDREEVGVSTLRSIFDRVARRGGSPVRIDGMDGMLTVFAKCCRPLPGDPILGFITRGRGVTVHSSSCAQGLSLPVERRVDVAWDQSHRDPHAVRIQVVTINRPMMLADLTKAVGKMNVNITSAEARTTRTDRGHIMLEVAVQDVSQLRNLMRGLSKLKGVISVERERGR